LDGGKVIVVALVVTGCYRTEVLDIVEEPFNLIVRFAGFPVLRDSRVALRHRGDHGLRPLFRQQGADGIAGIGAIGQQPCGRTVSMCSAA
jgi:hypothetical protein